MADEGSDGWPSYGTNEDKEYRFRPLHGKSLRFKVKAAHDCHISFTPVSEDTAEMFEVFIGAWHGAASAIRFKKGQDLAKVDTPDILSEDEPREFWITFDDGFVKVGHGGQWDSFMEAALPEPIEVKYYGYSTGWGAIGWWQFFNERILVTEDCKDYTRYEPVYGTSIAFTVSCGNDAHIALTSAPEDTEKMYEIFIGGWQNQKSAIRLNKDKEQTVAVVDTPDIVCSENERTFFVTFKDGNIKVGQHGSPPFMEYENTDPWKVTHVGYCTAWGASGKWKLEV